MLQRAQTKKSSDSPDAVAFTQERSGVARIPAMTDRRLGAAAQREIQGMANRFVERQNRPVQQVEHPAGAAVIQAYARIPVRKQRANHWNAGANLRVADDGRMAVPEGETHRMFATREIIQSADKIMKSQGSMYRIVAGQATLKGAAPGDRNTQRTLVEAIPINTVQGTCGDDMTTDEMCSTHGQEVMGAGLKQGIHPYQHGLAIRAGGEDRKWDRTGGGDNAIMEWARLAMTGLDQDAGKAATEAAYERLSKKKRKQRAKAIGINQYAIPEPGQALAVYSAVERLKKGYPMHFAAVIAKSGGDYVTFENYAKSDIQAGNLRAAGDTMAESKAWFFRMYGPRKRGDDQSFFGEHAKGGEQGGQKGTMVLRHVKVEGWADEGIAEIQRLYDIWKSYANIKLDRDNTPEFKQEFERFEQLFKAYKRDASAKWLQDEDLAPERQEALRAAMTACRETEIGGSLAQNPDVAAAPAFERSVRESHERFDTAMSDLPEEKRWKLFIEQSRQAEGPMAFDNDAEPGYLEAMTKALAHVRQTLGTPLTLEYYVDLHRRAVAGVKHRIAGQFDTNPPPLASGMSAGETRYGMQSAPSPQAMAELHEERVLATFAVPKTARGQYSSLYLDSGLMAHGVYTNYPNLEVAAEHLNRIINRYATEIGRAETERAKLEAIVRVVRALSVGHFFQDANRRVTEFLLLQKLLIENGFRPTIIPEQSVFDGRKSIEELVEAVYTGMKNLIVAGRED